jgi:hypothetical protein
MGDHVDTGQAITFKVVYSFSLVSYDWELNRCGFFRPGTTKLGESTNERREASSMVFPIKPVLVPSLERCLQWQIQEVVVRAHLEAYTTYNLYCLGAGLIF